MSTKTSSKFLSPENTVLTDVGPCLHEDGVTYRVWALGHRTVVAHIEKPEGQKYFIKLEPAKDSGYFWGIDPKGAAGDLYKYSVDDAEPIPDFLSHYQPQGALGPSMVVDAQAFLWQATGWKRPRWNGQVVYECHLGTFTPEGSYRAAIEKIDYLFSLGVTALEIMPVADWSGDRNWGYDGTFLFAPSRAYGKPDDFRALIDACHVRGIAVILDIVFNHLGPEGNFSHQYSDFYFHEGKDNPWGQNFNLDGPNSEPVRAFLRQNIRYWLEEFRIDGFRMDATHMIHDPSPIHLLAEVSDIVHERGGFIIAEDDRNARSIMDPHEKNGGWNFDAVWSDDFHHSMRVSQTGEQEYFLSMFRGDAQELARILQRGWLYSGEYSAFHKKPRGTAADDFPPQSFVFCISNHDQVGNRIQGVRLHESVSPESYRAISLFLCLSPYTPLLFMGQEWAASAPFHYFTNMSDELGAKITEGRRREFLETGFAKDPSELAALLSPQDEQAFAESKLDWSETEQDDHRRLLDLYRAGLKLRKELFGMSNPSRDQFKVSADEAGIRIDYHLPQRAVSIYLRLKSGEGDAPASARVLLRSNAIEFSGQEKKGGPETLVLAQPESTP
jgi:maltooligosyltrehalose trehalohydrolase